MMNGHKLELELLESQNDLIQINVKSSQHLTESINIQID